MTTSAPVTPSRRGDRPRRLLRESRARHEVLTVTGSALTLGANLATGVLLARVLGAAGRGTVAAIQTSTQVVAWIFLVGSVQTIAYYQARDPKRGGALLGTWLVILVPLTVAAFLTGQLLLPVVLAAQSPHTLELARLFMTTVGLVLLTELVAGYILGNQRFLLFNLLRVATPAVVALSYLLLWLSGQLNVSTALWSFIAIQATSIGATLVVCARWHGLARPDRRLARETLWYGFRAHSTNISTILTARLDLLIMPAFLSASSLGLYSVATNVSWIVFSVAGSLALVVLPIATVAGERGPAAIVRSLHRTAVVATVLAVIIGLLADVAVQLVYGEAFAGSVLALRLLLPGTVLYSMALVLVSGLYAAHRPLLAATTQGVGLILTVVGLLLFLKQGGIEAAAIVSSVAYAVVLVVALATYRSVVDLAWRDFLRVPEPGGAGPRSGETAPRPPGVRGWPR